MLLHEGPHLERQAEEVDEAFRIGLVVYVVFAESDKFFIVQGVRRRRTSADDVALIEFQCDLAGNGLLRFIDESRQGFAKRREPFAVIDEFGKFIGYIFFIVVRVAVEAEMMAPPGFS